MPALQQLKINLARKLGLEDEDGLLVIPAADATFTDELVRTLRDADQR